MVVSENRKKRLASYWFLSVLCVNQKMERQYYWACAFNTPVSCRIWGTAFENPSWHMSQSVVLLKYLWQSLDIPLTLTKMNICKSRLLIKPCMSTNGRVYELEPSRSQKSGLNMKTNSRLQLIDFRIWTQSLLTAKKNRVIQTIRSRLCLQSVRCASNCFY